MMVYLHLHQFNGIKRLSLILEPVDYILDPWSTILAIAEDNRPLCQLKITINASPPPPTIFQ